MNYNLKRFTRPIKGICDCNYKAVKRIGCFASNDIECKPYNKQFFMKRLGEFVDRNPHDDCKETGLAIPFVNGVSGNAGVQVTFSVKDEQINQGMLIITTESTSNIIKNVSLVYPSKYISENGVARSLEAEQYNDLFTTVPLSVAELDAMYNRAKDNYKLENWKGAMAFNAILPKPTYDYKLYVYLFPERT